MLELIYAQTLEIRHRYRHRTQNLQTCLWHRGFYKEETKSSVFIRWLEKSLFVRLYKEAYHQFIFKFVCLGTNLN